MWFLLSLLLVGVVYSGSKPSPGGSDVAIENDVNSNYLIYLFNGETGTYFPYAVTKDLCHASAISNPEGNKFYCSEDKTYIIYEQHSTSKCIDDDPYIQYINTTYMTGKALGYDTSLPENRNKLGAYECNAQDEYAEVTFQIGGCKDVDTKGSTIAAALNVCASLPVSATSSNERLRIWCQDEDAQMQYFNASGDPDCEAEMTQHTNYANATCDLIFLFGPTNIAIYGQMKTCTIQTLSSTQTPNSTSKYQHHLFINIIIIIIIIAIFYSF